MSGKVGHREAGLAAGEEDSRASQIASGALVSHIGGRLSILPGRKPSSPAALGRGWTYLENPFLADLGLLDGS